MSTGHKHTQSLLLLLPSLSLPDCLTSSPLLAQSLGQKPVVGANLGAPTVSSTLTRPETSLAVLLPGSLHSPLPHSPSCSSPSLTHLHFTFVLLLVLQYLEYKVFPALMVPSGTGIAADSQAASRLSPSRAVLGVRGQEVCRAGLLFPHSPSPASQTTCTRVPFHRLPAPGLTASCTALAWPLFSISIIYAAQAGLFPESRK